MQQALYAGQSVRGLLDKIILFFIVFLQRKAGDYETCFVFIEARIIQSETLRVGVYMYDS